MDTNGIDLTKCNNLRYRAKVDGNNDYGRICVENADTGLAFLRSDLENGYIATWHYDVSVIDGCCGRIVTDFDLVPRDPDTYQDWQVGDKVCDKANRGMYHEVISRSGELVIFKDWNNWASCPMTCSEAFTRFRFRLVLTDIEQRIIEDRKKAEWTPQDGDICYVKGAHGVEWVFIKNGRDHKTASYVSMVLDNDSLDTVIAGEREIKELRPATDEEKQKLFDAMAKGGKRWNAEKKVVEDIPKPYEFKKGEPVLVRDYDDNIWKLAAFRQRSGNASYPYEITNAQGNCYSYRYCLPYNEKTMHLLGTNEDYKEE